MKCPCKDCEKRYVGCHGDCLEYKEWSSENERLKQKYKNERDVNRMVTDDIIMQRIRYKKRKGK